MTYLDHAATSPLRPEARAAWLAASEVVGNASSIHRGGQDARRLLEESREQVAAVLGCDPVEVVFTSGGTESVNLALQGLWGARDPGRPTLVLPDGEHHATMDTAQRLWADRGAQLRHVGLDAHGAIPVPRFRAALADAALATAMIANNEVGTVNDAAGLAAAAADAGVPLHLDAVAALGHLPFSFAALRGDADAGVGLCALSVSAHKVGGPVGVGALVVARTARIQPLLHGGAQQRGLRPGTQDVAGAVAFAAAAVATVAERDREAARLTALRERLIAGVLALPGTRLLGDPVRRLPGNAHVLFDGAAGETLLFLLDQAGIQASTGSACQAGVAEPSHVVLALGLDEVAARSVLRFTLGRTSTRDDVDALLRVLPDALARARAAASVRS
ncbi:cysteine desulfurase family protein [Microbacterium sp. GXF7504]